MNRLFLIFFCSMMFTLLTKAMQNGPMDDYETAFFLYQEDTERSEVASYFAGETWLENKVLSNMVDLDKIYQEKAFTRKLTNDSHVKRYIKSYSTWVEERVCNESPFIDKPIRANVTSRYGYRTHPLSGRRHVHAGIDFRGKTGTPVLAGSAGIVKTTGRKGAYGKTIIIDHGNSFTTLYGHLSGFAVKEGQWVNLGQTIGYIGRTGRATGPHLHFEVRCHNIPLNPSNYLGKMGQIAEVKFHKKTRNYHRPNREPAFVKRDPNYYTRMINMKKLEKLNDKVKKF